jgi:DNA-binding LytR/AlgR family response regulator
MILNAIALDDEPPALDVIEELCRQNGSVNLIKTFTSAAEVLAYLSEHKVDFLFLDIQMPEVNGVAFYSALTDKIPVIFTTAHANYALNGFDLSATDYLLKPISLPRFNQAIEKMQEKISVVNNRSTEIQIKADYTTYKIDTAKIRYIEGLDDYVKIFIENHKTLVVRATMKGMLEKLPQQKFMRVHRSFIIPLARVVSYRNKYIKLIDAEIPLSLSYEKEFKEKLGQ